MAPFLSFFLFSILNTVYGVNSFLREDLAGSVIKNSAPGAYMTVFDALKSSSS